MGLLSFLTSGTKAAENATDIAKTLTGGFVAGIDALVFTDEEKAEYSANAGKLYLDFWKTFGTENSEQSKARRELAKMTFKNFWRLVWMLIATKALSLTFPQIAPLVDTINVILFSTIILTLVSGVAGAYFIPHQISKVYTKK